MGINVHSQQAHMTIGIIVIMLIILGLISCVPTCVTMATEEEITVTITEKTRVHHSNSSHWMIFAEDSDGDLYELTNQDHWVWYMKTNSSTVQNQLRVGENYTLLVGGLRFTWLSWYPNILEIREFPTNE